MFVEYHKLDAVGRCNFETTQYVVASGPPVNVSDAYKRTLLNIACHNGHKCLVVYLFRARRS